MPIHASPDTYDPFTILEQFTPDRYASDEWDLDIERAAAEALVVGAVRERFEQAKNAKETLQQIVDRNYLLLKGESRLARTSVSNETLRVVSDSDPRKGRSTDNIIIDKHRAFVGKFTRAVPMVRSRARSSDKEDLMAAEVMDSKLDFFRLASKIRLIYKRWVEAISPAGTGIAQLYWDPAKGPVIGKCDKCGYTTRDEQPGEPCPTCMMQADETAQVAAEAAGMQDMGIEMEPIETPPVGTLQEAREGDLCTRTIQLRDYFPDPGATIDPTTVMWAIVTDAIHVAKLRKMFPDKANSIDEEEGIFADRYIWAPTGLANARIETRELKSHAQLMTYYEMPSGLHEDGRVIYVCNDKVLGIRPFVESRLLSRLPFFYARGDTDEDTLWGMDIISQAEPQQRERDVLVTQCRRWRDLTLHPVGLKTSMAGIHNKRMSTVPGEWITANRIDENNLRFMKVPQLPSYVPGELNRLDEAAQRKFGVTAHELGIGDPGESGRYAAFLETQASETIGPMVIEVNEEFLEMHRAAIEITRYYESDDRVWTTTSRGRIFTHSWGEANVTPGWDVYLVNVDAVSRNPVLRRQYANEQFQIGYYTDQATGRINWDDYRLDAGVDHDMASSDSEACQHIKAAELPKMIENAIVNGQPLPMPKPWDNAYTMASGLADWLRGPGETHQNSAVVQAVTAVWWAYCQPLLPDPSLPPDQQVVDPEVAKVLPNAAFSGQQGQQAGPGTGGSRPGQQAGGKKPGAGTPRSSQSGTQSAGQETAQKVRNADRTAERTSRGNRPHES